MLKNKLLMLIAVLTVNFQISSMSNQDEIHSKKQERSQEPNCNHLKRLANLQEKLIISLVQDRKGNLDQINSLIQAQENHLNQKNRLIEELLADYKKFQKKLITGFSAITLGAVSISTYLVNEKIYNKVNDTLSNAFNTIKNRPKILLNRINRAIKLRKNRVKNKTLSTK